MDIAKINFKNTCVRNKKKQEDRITLTKQYNKKYKIINKMETQRRTDIKLM